MQETSYPSPLPTLSPRSPLRSPPRREVPTEWREPTTLQLPELMGSPVDQEGTLQTPPPQPKPIKVGASQKRPRPPGPQPPPSPLASPSISPSPSSPRRSWQTPWRPRLLPPPNPPGSTRWGPGSTTSRAPRPTRRHHGWRQHQQTNKMNPPPRVKSQWNLMRSPSCLRSSQQQQPAQIQTPKC